MIRRTSLLVAVLVVLAAACSSGSSSAHGRAQSTATTSATKVTAGATTTEPSTTTMPPTTTSTAPPPSTTTTLPPLPPPPATLRRGSSGLVVAALQQRLLSLGYWLDTTSGNFDDSTQQAVYAYQKAAGVAADGSVGPITAAALARGVVPTPQSHSGYVVEVDLERDLLMVVDNGHVAHVLNVSTGGGYSYASGTGFARAITPRGHFTVYRQIDGLRVSTLGQLWRPKYFDGGFAIHGDSDVPPRPVSHGCVRVTDEAIDWIWSSGIIPLGTPVWLY